ncbi:MAG: hypothetical protein CMJ36_03945 [Phycisphaerae bacterium]|nr:hypothetical protein [Phycisphaerae bacterium]
MSPGSARAAEAFRRINQQPSWVMKAAALAFLIVFGLPILLLLVLAAIAASVVFAILGLFNALVGGAKSRRGPEAKRRNVRVINRD